MIEIYGKPHCPYCDKAKHLCEMRGMDFVYYELDKDFTKEQLFEKFPNARTFPQIRTRKIEATYEYIGGYEELSKQLGDMLK